LADLPPSQLQTFHDHEELVLRDDAVLQEHMYFISHSKQLQSFDKLSPLEQEQLVKAAERLWGEELSPKEAFAFNGFGDGCVIQYIEKDDVPVYELWSHGDVGVIFEAGTDTMAPMAMLQHGIISLVQGFEEIAAGLQRRSKKFSTNTEHLIRDAKEEDAAQIVVILQEIIDAKRYTIMQSISLDEQLAYMRSFPSRGVFLVAEHNGSVVGLQSIEPMALSTQKHVAEISTFVSLSQHKKHIGQSLMVAMKQRAKEKGMTKLVACVRAGNKGAIQFYESQGFARIGVREAHHLIDGVFHDEVLLELLLR
jgi:L-amino acid N-acyltransferase YncA